MGTKTPKKRAVIRDGEHTTEVLRVLRGEIPGEEALSVITERAAQIVERAIDPIAGPPTQPSDGLLYGLIQSGKTSIITVAAAMAADNGFQVIVILTSDIDVLYDQTLNRLKRAMRGVNVLGKNEWREGTRFERQLRTTPFVVVCSKNANRLNSLLEAFKTASARGLSVLLIDDEADQASLNTRTSSGTGQISRINEVITEFRDYFPSNTYLQVTATPQALFLQRPDHRYRPSFSVLSAPGPGYIGGEHFFGAQSADLLRDVPLNEVDQMRATRQPQPSGSVPAGLRRALDTFLVAATGRLIEFPNDNFAFLCHVSVNKRDHDYIVGLIDRYKEEALRDLHNNSSNVRDRLRDTYTDLHRTESKLPDIESILDRVKFYLGGASVKLLNSSTGEEIVLDSAMNIFVGGNKLGRGVTIKNLLVSYYGRNPKRPNADTVLQHARMYGYRERDLGITRLFLPSRLADHFRLIHQMESGLRDLLAKYPDGKFEGIFVSSPLEGTRRNVLDPNSLGYYVAGQGPNPSYPLRTAEVRPNTEWIDDKLRDVPDEVAHEVTVDDVYAIIEHCKPDPRQEIKLWDLRALKGSLETIKTLFGNHAYIVVKRGLRAAAPRRETQGIISGKGEEDLAPKAVLTLYLHREEATKAEEAVWWPQVRFPEGNYVLAFSFDW
jgi:hypothetical protein